MSKIKFGLVLIAVIILTGSLLPISAANASLFGDAVTSSMTEVEKYFDITNPDKVSVVQENNYSVISMKSGNSGHWIISKKPVLSPNYTYTVELAGESKTGAELSVFVGADPRFLNGVQVYLTKRGNGQVTLDGAIREAGLYNKVISCTPDVADADSKDTYFKIELQVFEYDIDIYLNDEYLETITMTEEVEGHVGVRCSSAGGELRIKSMSLVEEAADNTTPDTSSTIPPTATPTEMPTGSDEITATKTPVAGTTQKVDVSTPMTNAPTQDVKTDENSGISMGAVGGIVLGVVVVICVIAVVVFFIIKKKNTP